MPKLGTKLDGDVKGGLEKAEYPEANLYVKIRGQGPIRADRAEEITRLAETFIEAVTQAGVHLTADVVATPVTPPPPPAVLETPPA